MHKIFFFLSISLFLNLCSKKEDLIQEKLEDLKKSEILKFSKDINSTFKRSDSYYIFYKDTTFIIDENTVELALNRYPILEKKEIYKISNFIFLLKKFEILKCSVYDSVWVFNSKINKDEFHFVYSKKNSFKDKIQKNSFNEIVLDEDDWFVFKPKLLKGD